jgi:CheY-like chemotaxis protein
VAKGLLLPYGLKLETCTSGYESIERIKAGNLYDIIFMDHMMPHLDGIETVKILRDMGYSKTIIALTANAITGQAEMFMENGFDGFLAKPIDLRELNTTLNTQIRDKQSPEALEMARAKNQKADAPQRNGDVHSEVVKAFITDAEKSFHVLEEIGGKGGIRLFTTTIHGLKSALSNIGETELSADAHMLEKAGREGDVSIVAAETPVFLEKLKAVISKVKPPDEAFANEISEDDKTFLREKLSEIKVACDTLDRRAVKAALSDLKQIKWTREIHEAIENIGTLILHSEFKDASDIADKLIF